MRCPYCNKEIAAHEKQCPRCFAEVKQQTEKKEDKK
jgi:hypothetical protein